MVTVHHSTAANILSWMALCGAGILKQQNVSLPALLMEHSVDAIFIQTIKVLLW